MINRGKQWEKRFEQDWQNSFPQGVVIRLADQVSGYKNTSKNICDFICFDSYHFWLAECKTITGNTFPASNFTQLEKLLPYASLPNVRAGVFIWYIDHSRVLFIPASSFKRLIDDGLKSFNINKTSFEKYNAIEIPCKVKRVFPKCDYTSLQKLEDDYGTEK